MIRTLSTITVNFTGKSVEIVVEDRFPTVKSVVEKALAQMHARLGKYPCRFYFETDIKQRAWTDPIPADCNCITILRLFTLYIVYDEVRQNSMNVLEGTLLADAIGRQYIFVTPDRHIISIDDAELSKDAYWTFAITDDVTVSVKSKLITKSEFPPGS